MRSLWTNLTEKDHAAFRVTVAFLNGRLEERTTIEWALRLRPNDIVKRSALLDLINNSDGQKIKEPWCTAWRLIEQSWRFHVDEAHNSSEFYRAVRRIKAGDRSTTLISSIVDLVAPRLEVKTFSPIDLHYRKMPKRAKSLDHLFLAGLTSGDALDPDKLGLTTLDDTAFLGALANGLDAAVMNGLDIARNLGWDGERQFSELGELRRAYFVPLEERPAGEYEPDEYHHGISPSVKLLHATVSRLAALADVRAIDFVRRWKVTCSPVHLRLWAALSRDPEITSSAEVGAALLELNDRAFWNLHIYPEVGELRAKRFEEFSASNQRAILARIQKRPPRSQWPKGAGSGQVENARLFLAVAEMRRIEVAGSVLPAAARAWLNARIDQFPELHHMSRLNSPLINCRDYFRHTTYRSLCRKVAQNTVPPMLGLDFINGLLTRTS